MRDKDLSHAIIGAAIEILRLSGSLLVLLINFNVLILKDSIRRYVWHYEEKDNAETQSSAETRREEQDPIHGEPSTGAS
jgi:hypothetical protein